MINKHNVTQIARDGGFYLRGDLSTKTSAFMRFDNGAQSFIYIEILFDEETKSVRIQIPSINILNDKHMYEFRDEYQKAMLVRENLLELLTHH